MKFLISPAKSLNYNNDAITKIASIPQFLNFSEEIIKVLKKLNINDLENLMSISNNLASINFQRFQDWKLPFDESKCKQAVFAFDGEVYNGLNAKTLHIEQIDYLQKNLRILSGLYGILRPLDSILPYRLEMGTKIGVNTHKNLYEFWKKQVTESLHSELLEHEVIINLASKEYFEVIDKKNIKNKIITPEFKDYKNNKLSTISFFAKKARGLMVRYAIDNQIENQEDLKNFSIENYQFDQNLSTEKNWIFTR
ncbi:MAG: peroxide stress protein YaaA [Flavobacterium sp.]|jgi:cytoplasmic iron level regulating protein YaaA (DUF328/UPF0246 family)